MVFTSITDTVVQSVWHLSCPCLRKKMPGQHGNQRVSLQNVKVVNILPEQNVILFKVVFPDQMVALLNCERLRSARRICAKSSLRKHPSIAHSWADSGHAIVPSLFGIPDMPPFNFKHRSLSPPHTKRAGPLITRWAAVPEIATSPPGRVTVIFAPMTSVAPQ